MQRHHFSSDGVDIAFIDEGEGDPILLIHGFASNLAVNWVGTGWVETLKRHGMRVIAMDVRGHGQSEKLYRTEDYRLERMAKDASNLLDHLGIGRADVFGYSMGARITAFLTLAEPGKVRSAILGGIGLALVEGMGGEAEIADGLEADSAAGMASEQARGYRRFAEHTGSDLRALAACMRVQRALLTPEMLATVRVPVLIAAGARDAVAGSPTALGRLIPGAEVFVIPDRDHMLATGDKLFKARVLAFLAERP